MTKNMGSTDRAVRAVAGVLLLILAYTAAPFAAGLFHWGAVVVGIVLLATSLLGVCPAYLPFGIRTCARGS